MTAITDFHVHGPDGSDIDLARYAGKVLLIVNTASKCGFTPQYEGLEALHRDLGPRGFMRRNLVEPTITPSASRTANGNWRPAAICASAMSNHSSIVASVGIAVVNCPASGA